MTRDDYYTLINAALVDHNWAAIPSALVAVALNSEVLDEDYELVLRCTHTPATEVRAVALICIAHLARIHRRLPDDRAVAIIKAALADPDPIVRGQADTAADDLEMFAPELGQHIRGVLLPNFLLWTPITWTRRGPCLWTAQVLDQLCELRRNDDPERPYSVSIGLEATELDALPTGWIIDLD